MDAGQVDQLENAINIAWNPSSSNDLKGQALNFIHQLRTDATAWQVCLPLFTRNPPPPDSTRHFCLDVVNFAIQSPQSDANTRTYIKDSLWVYVQQKFGAGQQATDSNLIRNKLTQTMTYLFTALYANGWDSFFDDFLTLAGSGSLGQSNIQATALYLRILGSIHDEIADVVMPRTEQEAKRNAQLKDLVRTRDAQKVSLSWQEILAKWRQIDLNIVETCLRAVSRWVSWVDISLVVNATVLQALLEMAGQQNLHDHDSTQVKIRDAAIDTFTEIASKKMRPAEKVELLTFLNLGTVVGQLVSSPPLAEYQNTPQYDTDLAETVAKLVNNVMRDLVIVLDTGSDDQTRQRADELLQSFVPYVLRFFSDEYDEVCSTVIDSLTDLLTLFRKIVKKNSLPAHYSIMLSPILNAIIRKMKYDETADWGEEGEETDEAEFFELRKRLNILQQYIAAIDEQMYMDTLTQFVASTLNKPSNELAKVDWRELDLALYEMYLFGDLASRNRGLYSKKDPSSVASARLIEMMTRMIESNIDTYPHPAIQLQFMELCVRYLPFFEQNQGFIPRALEIFVGYSHSSKQKVRAKAWYLFLRFVKGLRGHLGEVSQTIIQAIGDLLIIKASLPEDRDDDDDDDDASDPGRDPLFDSQIHLFEAVGCISSAGSIPLQTKILFLQSIMNPVFADMEVNINAAKSGEDRALLQLHHDIKALGTLARGYTDWMPGVKTVAPPPNEVSGEFMRAAEAILVALESLNTSGMIREASRFSLARLVGGCGTSIFVQLPRWIEGLLSNKISNEEMTYFLGLLRQVIFAFKGEIFTVLDAVLTPLLRRVFEKLSETPSGTDDEIQLNLLRREYLNFVLIILMHDLGGVFVSANNQSIFESFIEAVSHFARSPDDLTTSRLAFSVLTKMTSVWGGPDINLTGGANSNSPPTSPTSLPPSPLLPGFDQFAITKFSPLSWAIPSTPGFRVHDPSSRALVHDIAALQQEILKKTGNMYIQALGQELRGMGMGEADVELYLTKLGGDSKVFKDFLVSFLGRAGGS